MSGVLFDTHALVWLMEDVPSLGRRSAELADEMRVTDELLVSAISFWELGLLQNRGRIAFDRPMLAWRQRVLDYGVIEVPMTGVVGILATELQGLPRDPADRMITASAIEVGATLVTADVVILAWTGTLARPAART